MMAKAMNYEAIWTQVENLPWCALVKTGRTGSDFFQSLLDSHPEIFVFNGTLFLHQYWNEAYTTTYPEELDIDDVVDEFVGRHIYKFKSRYELEERKNELGAEGDRSIDISIPFFKEHIVNLFEHRSLNSKNFLIAVYVSHSLCLGQDLKRKRLFFHHVHQMRKLAPFLQDFPYCKIISMTRHPLAAYVSGVEHWRAYNSTTDHAEHVLSIQEEVLTDALPLLEYPNKVRVLRLEDLGREEILHEVCDWLGVSYDPCMRKSTWGGMRWWGDRLSNRPIRRDEEGYSPTITKNDWKTCLGFVERMLLDYLLADRLDWYGYGKKNWFEPVAFLLALVLIPWPSRYERRFLSPAYLFRAWRKGKYRWVLAPFYCYPKKRILLYELLFRKAAGRKFEIPFFGQDPKRKSLEPSEKGAV